jgi:hypothetical protein
MLENRLVSAIIIFLIIFSIVHWLKPPLIYNEHGGFRQFGIGYKQKTVIPIWVVSIILAIFCYMAVYHM